MPMKSVSQRGYLWAKHPKVAARFEAETRKGADLPEHVKKRKRQSDEMNAKLRAAAGT